MHPLRSSLPRFRDPVWLLFVPPLLGRGWLLLKHDTPASWTTFLIALLILLVSAPLTWLSAAIFAYSAGLSERGRERFTVMSTLSALALPLAFALKETVNWRSTIPLRALTLPAVQESLAVNSARICILLILVLAMLLAVSSCLLGRRLHYSVLTRLRQLTLLPLTYSACLCLLYLVLHALNAPEALQQNVIALFAFALPFFTAALFTTPYMITEWYHERASVMSTRRKVVLHIAMLVLIAIYFGSQLYTYCF